MISNIPFLHPEVWKGSGIPLSVAQEKTRQLMNNLNLSEKKNKPKVPRNPRKRKAEEALKMGAGMDPIHRDQELDIIEDKLHFLRNYSESDEKLGFELHGIDSKYNKGTSYKVSLALKPKSAIHQKLPSAISISVYNHDQKKNALKVKSIDQNRDKEERFIDN